MAYFKEALEDCCLNDLGFLGPKYTWNNGMQDAMFTKERLDRAMANVGWCTMQKRREVQVLAAPASDPKPFIN